MNWVEEAKKKRIYAQKTHKTKDANYNKGRQDCLNGYFYSKEAKYFLMCENY